MSAQNLLVIGQGDIGLPVTNQLATDGVSVMGLARSKRERYDFAMIVLSLCKPMLCT